MFNKDDKIAKDGRNHADSFIGKALTVQGDIVFHDSLYFDGQHKGNLTAGQEKNGVLIIGKNAKIKGKIIVTKVVILGQIEGDIYSDGLITLMSGSRVRGDIYYKDIDMRHGASITGNFCHNGGKYQIKDGEKNK